MERVMMAPMRSTRVNQSTRCRRPARCAPIVWLVSVIWCVYHPLTPAAVPLVGPVAMEVDAIGTVRPVPPRAGGLTRIDDTLNPSTYRKNPGLGGRWSSVSANAASGGEVWVGGFDFDGQSGAVSVLAPADATLAGSAFVERQRLTAPAKGSRFGHSVALDADSNLALVGAPCE